MSPTMNTTETSNRFAMPASGSSSCSSGSASLRKRAIATRAPLRARQRCARRGSAARGPLPSPNAGVPSDHVRRRAARETDDRRRERHDHLPCHRVEIPRRERRERGAHRNQRAEQPQARADFHEHARAAQALARALLVREHQVLEPAVARAGLRSARARRPRADALAPSAIASGAPARRRARVLASATLRRRTLCARAGAPVLRRRHCPP